MPLRRRSVLHALALVGLSGAARADRVVLTPRYSGTMVVDTRNPLAGSAATTKTTYDTSRYTVCRTNEVQSGALVRVTDERAFFQISLAPVPEGARISSATYTMHRVERTGFSHLTTMGQSSSTSSDQNDSFDVTAAIVAQHRYVGSVARFTTRYAVSGNTPSPGANNWYGTGEFAPTLTVEYTVPPAVFTPLGSLRSRGFFSSARALSLDGSTIVGVTDSETGDRAFVWNAKRGMFDIGVGARGAAGVSNDGQIVVGAGNPQGGYLWVEDGSGAWLGNDAVVRGVSPTDPWAVGSSIDANGMRSPTCWTRGYTGRVQATIDGKPVPAQATAIDVSMGTMAGSSLPYPGASVPTRPFVWDLSGKQTAIPPLPGGTGEGEALDMRGHQTVVGWSWGARGPEAFLWTPSGILGLGNLRNSDGTLGNASRANAMSPSNIIVGAAVRDGRNRAFIWHQEYGMQDLQDLLASWGEFSALAGWTLFDATGVMSRPDGMIVVAGTGRDPWGRTQAFHALLPGLTKGPY